MSKPFHGVRIIDFTHMVAGPFGSYQLGLMGADVIKIEKRGGEDMRFGSLTPEWGKKGYSPGWAGLNGNKRSLTLDLKRPEAIEIIRTLVKDADVVMENFRPGVMDELGIGYEALKAIQPRLIYCGVSGFGNTGPERNSPAFDGMIQAVSGMMSMTGDPSTGPVRTGFAAADILTGMTAAFAISSALFQRVQTGKGQFIDVSMFDATMSFMTQQLTECLIGGHIQGTFGNLSVSRKPTANMFPTASGNLIVSVINEKQYVNFMRAIGRADLLDDPRFATWASRIDHTAEIRAAIIEAMKDGTAQEWEARLRAADIPCGCVRNVREALDDPQLQSRNVLQPIEGPLGPMTLIGTGFRMDHGEGGIERPPPLAGQHSEELLREAGYSEERIAALRQGEVI